MLDVCLLGTGGMMPLPYRFLTSLMARFNGSNLLIDCGEGTQITIRKKGWSFKAIDCICFTHYHGDHISGLPGLLLTIGNSERKDPLTLIGPKGLERVVNGLRVIAPELPFDIHFIELTDEYHEISLNGYRIEAFSVKHNIPCYGYNLNIDRLGRFSPEKATAFNLPVKFWSILQKGERVIYEGKEFLPSMVMGEARKGLKVSYVTDTRPTASIENNVKDADLFVCEGMYGDEVEKTNAVEYKHMTFEEAARLAKNGGVKELWLTHFSPSLVYPKEHEQAALSIFANTIIPKDRRAVSFKFEEN